jgi:hypothetical protein
VLSEEAIAEGCTIPAALRPSPQSYRGLDPWSDAAKGFPWLSRIWLNAAAQNKQDTL